MPQVDLFENVQGEPPKLQKPDPSAVRQRLLAALCELRGAEEFPWTRRQLNSWRHVFRNMAKWLPEDESSRLQMEFRRELDRWNDEQPANFPAD